MEMLFCYEPLARTRYTWPINERVRAQLEKVTESKAGVADGGRVQDTPTPGVQMHPTGGVQNTPTQSCINQSCSSHLVKATKADSQPTNRKNRNSPAVPDCVAEKRNSKEPAFRGDWAEVDLLAIEDFLSEHEPDDTEDHGNGEWVPEATLNAGGGASAEEVLSFLDDLVYSGSLLSKLAV